MVEVKDCERLFLKEIMGKQEINNINTNLGKRTI